MIFSICDSFFDFSFYRLYIRFDLFLSSEQFREILTFFLSSVQLTFTIFKEELKCKLAKYQKQVPAAQTNDNQPMHRMSIDAPPGMPPVPPPGLPPVPPPGKIIYPYEYIFHILNGN